MRTTLGADRSRQHFEAHLKGETVTQLDVRSEDVVDWATRGGSKALGLDSKIGSIEVGKRADIVLIKNDESPVMFPIVNPYGHVAMQAQRADVHTVVIDGNIVKHEHRLINIDLDRARSAVEETVEFLADTIGEEAWNAGMHPDLRPKEIIDNPYHYNK
jgi:cytosine/adenosine deaminase-related metal-dependent hydrolase